MAEHARRQYRLTLLVAVPDMAQELTSGSIRETEGGLHDALPSGHVTARVGHVSSGSGHVTSKAVTSQAWFLTWS
eukprot:1567494-Rhodomonas_salina.2